MIIPPQIFFKYVNFWAQNKNLNPVFVGRTYF